MISFVFMWVTTVIGRIKCLTLGDQNFQDWLSKAHNMKAQYDRPVRTVTSP